MNETESIRDDAFWQELATLSRESAASAGPPRAVVRDEELDDLIQRYLTGELDPREESLLRRLASQSPNLAAQLAHALAAFREVEACPAGSAERVWSQLATPPASYSAPARIVDLAVRLLADGLELLHSAGRPAYPAWATRSAAPAPALSVAQEFLTTAGILDVVVDFRDAACWQLVVRPRLLSSSERSRDLTLRLRDANGPLIDERPLSDDGLVIDSLAAGEYELIVAEGQHERSRLLISCLAR